MHATTSGLFDGIAGLPLHPLVVHFAVVILPLSALGLIAIIIRPSWQRTFGWLVLAGLVIGTGAAFVAKESGEALSTHVGLPEEHADYGNLLPLVAVLLVLVAIAWFFAARSATVGRGIVTGLGAVAVILALVTSGLTVLVGHTGAEAAWAGTLDSGSSSSASGDGAQGDGAAATPAPAASAAASTAASAAPAATPSGYTLADVQAHAKKSDCWTAIDGNVYDVTKWISQHPGGAQAIESLCGIDGSSAFDGQHGGQARPARELKGFLLGPLQG